jgi:hypothetical protein
MIAQPEARASRTAARGAPSPVPAQPASSGPVVVLSGPGGVAARVLSGHSAGGMIRPVRAAPLLSGRRGAPGRRPDRARRHLAAHVPARR